MHIKDLDLSKITCRVDTRKKGYYIVDVHPAGVKMTISVRAETEEEAKEHILGLLRNQIKRLGLKPNEGSKK